MPRAAVLQPRAPGVLPVLPVLVVLSVPRVRRPLLVPRVLLLALPQPVPAAEVQPLPVGCGPASGFRCRLS